MKNLLLAVLLAGSFSGLGAAPILWTVQNAVFSDGGTLTGSFTYDAALSQFGSYRLEVAGGGVNLFPPFVYQNGVAPNTGTRLSVANSLVFETSLFQIQSVFATRELRLYPVGGPLPLNGGTVNLITGVSSVECFNCGLFRVLASGSLVGTAANPIPEPSTFALLALGGAVLVGWKGKRRRI